MSSEVKFADGAWFETTCTELVCVRLGLCCSAPAAECGSCMQLGSRAGQYRRGAFFGPERRAAVEHRLVPEGICHLLSVESLGLGDSCVGSRVQPYHTVDYDPFIKCQLASRN